MSGGCAQAHCWFARALLLSARPTSLGASWFTAASRSPVNLRTARVGRQERERSTLRYIMAKFPFEKSAMVWLADMVDPPASSTKEFVFTEGIKIHRPVWDEAHRVTQVSGI